MKTLKLNESVDGLSTNKSIVFYKIMVMHDTISIIYVIMGHNFGNKYLRSVIKGGDMLFQIQMLKAFG